MQEPFENPKLKKARDILSRDVDPWDVAEDLIQQMKRIHASYLFHSKGHNALRQFCLLLSSTPWSLQFNSWKDLAAHLNLSDLQNKCIENYNNRDYTENVLAAYALMDDATIGQIIKALYNIQRYDVISAVKDELLELKKFATDDRVSLLIAKNVNPEELLMKPHPNIIKKIQADTFLTLKPPSNDNVDKEINRREIIPDEIIKCAVEPFTNQRLVETVVQSCYSMESIKIPKHPKPKYKVAVMLTFAPDGKENAAKVADYFRREREGYGRIGVLILDQQRGKVDENPERFIMHYFHQMKFIVPILTPEYFEALAVESQEYSSSLDSQYIPYIHDLMVKNYASNSCRNNKVRCIIPDKHAKFVTKHPHFKIDPVLQVYVVESQINELVNRILKIPS